MSSPRHSLLFIVPVCAAVATIGCEPRVPESELMLAQELDQVTLEKERIERQLAARDALIAELRTQIENLIELGPGRLDMLFTTADMQLVDLTGGADYDGEPGDDGVTVYLRPIDAQGDALKAAGEIRIQLLDLTREGQPRELGLYVVNDPGELRKAWHSGFLTDHYTVRCGWQPGLGPPQNREVTIRATFVDWLTGREHTAQKAVEVSLVEDTPK